MGRFLAIVIIYLGLFVSVSLWVGVFAKFTHGVNWYAELKAWQTGLGAFGGLLAILAGAFYNAELNRQRDRELRDEEARGLATTLAANVKALHWFMSNKQYNMAESLAAGVTLSPMQIKGYCVPDSAIIPISTKNLYSFGNDLASSVVNFYGLISWANHRLETCRSNPVDSLTLDPDNENHQRLTQVYDHPASVAAKLADGLEIYAAGGVPPRLNISVQLLAEEAEAQPHVRAAEVQSPAETVEAQPSARAAEER